MADSSDPVVQMSGWLQNVLSHMDGMLTSIEGKIRQGAEVRQPGGLPLPQTLPFCGGEQRPAEQPVVVPQQVPVQAPIPRLEPPTIAEPISSAPAPPSALPGLYGGGLPAHLQNLPGAMGPRAPLQAPLQASFAPPGFAGQPSGPETGPGMVTEASLQGHPLPVEVTSPIPRGHNLSELGALDAERGQGPLPSHTSEALGGPGNLSDMVNAKMARLNADVKDTSSIGIGTVAGVGAGVSAVAGGAAAVVPGLEEFAPILEGIAALGGLVAVLAPLTAKLQEMDKAAHAANIRFAEFSGPMAAVEIRQQVREIHLARVRGSRRADSAEQLAESSFRVEEAWAPIEDKMAQLYNDALTKLNNTLVPVLDNLTDGLRSAGWIGPKDNAKDDVHTWLSSFSDIDWDKYGRPTRTGRFGGP